MNRVPRPHTEYDVEAPTHRDDYDHMYSARLDDLVQRCVSMVPDERPNLARLLWETEEGVSSARQRCATDPWGRRAEEIEKGLRVRWPRTRELEIGADMGEVWRYHKRRRVAEERGWSD